ncbi:T9SS type A sorting domain-containing protein [Taibaiella soli]|uniref:Secretion system C-terminal sorting domain-containing protein n=1 Tax=Taibaiella soli TaxID=1649169 RepID=A0A2W2ABN2_9BACT|nr:T9SS type A sorting domain-containing protein [Taibaiella soli]PZF71022.1 hypothetical protein DN068_20175 [Taibaiella soli]
MKKFFTLLSVSVFSLFAAERATATTHMVMVADFTFNPNQFTMNLGDTVLWMWSSGTHNTTSTNIPSGAASWGNPIDGSHTTFAYVPAVAGTYNYECTFHVSSGMTGTFIVTGSTNVPAVNNPTPFSVAPNPASGMVTIQTDMINPSISIYDCAGRAISLVHIVKNGNQMLLDVAPFPAGMYVLRLTSGDQSQLQKIVVVH